MKTEFFGHRTYLLTWPLLYFAVQTVSHLRCYFVVTIEEPVHGEILGLFTVVGDLFMESLFYCFSAGTTKTTTLCMFKHTFTVMQNKELMMNMRKTSAFDPHL